jgi:trans-2,3-dihydro-3-hydroxyanthranilate isomerase
LKADAIFIFAPDPVKAENQIHARCFVHLHGAPEDPATGSANGCFAGWLVHQRYFGTGRIQVRVEQGYMLGRPSLILLDADEEEGEIIVNVGGKAFLIARGELLDNL